MLKKGALGTERKNKSIKKSAGYCTDTEVTAFL